MIDRQPTLLRQTATIAGVAIALAVTTTGLRAQAQPTPAANVTVEQVRAALEKYKDPIVALRDGYLSSVACIDFPGGGSEPMAGHDMARPAAMTGMTHTMDYRPGAMGIHFLNMALVGPVLDPLKPQVLLYEPVKGKLVLAGAEWFVPTQLAKTPPTILGHELQGPMEGHAPIMPAELHHWDLHVWLFKDNPNGMFHPTNSALKCPKGDPYSVREMAPKIVEP